MKCSITFRCGTYVADPADSVGQRKGGDVNAIGIIGIVLIVLGGVVVALQGVSYVRDRQEVRIGPIELTTEERGFIPPVVGGLVLVAGVVLVLIGRRRA
jgi:hypothetical protein